MTGRTHDLAAVTALGVVALSIPSSTLFATPLTLSTVLIALAANMFGGIAPDIDEPTAPFWRNLPIGGKVGKVIAKLLGGHRFLTHSLLGVALLGFLAWLLLKFLSPIMPHTNIVFVWWAFIIGVLSHLVLDTFTKEGVPWLLPIPVKFGLPPVRSWRITTGELLEVWVLFPALLLFNLYFYSTHYQQLFRIVHQIKH